MNKKTIYMETGSTDPYFNLAFEEFVLAHRTDGDYLLLWQNDNTIVIGQNQNAEAEIYRRFVEEQGIRVVRRMTGGGAVYHDLGNLNYSFITDVENAETLTIRKFTEPVVAALRGLGLQAEASGRNDILVEGQKVSGTAQRIMGERLLHHGTLLFDSNLGAVASALRVDPAKFQSKSAKSVSSRVGNIRHFLKEDMDTQSFWEYLKRALSNAELVVDKLSPEELTAVQKLKTEKYDTWDWNFGRSPRYTMTNRARWDAGGLEVFFCVEKGYISEAVFMGDFLSRQSLEKLLSALQGVPFSREAVELVLERFPLENLFGGIRKEEILQTIFGY